MRGGIKKFVRESDIYPTTKYEVSHHTIIL